MREKVVKLYEYFYQIFSNYRDFEFRPTDRQKKTIDNFLLLLTPSHGEEWLFDYFCFQFGRYYTMNTRFGKGKIMLNWVIGKKSLDYYKNASDEEKYYGREVKRKFSLKNPLIEVHTTKLTHLDIERKRFYNTDLGLLHCRELDLYEEKNKYCIMCKNKNYCNG